MNAKERQARKDEYGCTLVIDTLDDHPQVITDQLGLQASEIIVKGSSWLSPISKRVIEGKFNESNLWIYEVERELSSLGIYLNNPLEKMLKIMDTNKELFVSILKKYPKNHVLCYAYFYDANPYFKLNTAVISRLNAYGIDVEFDLYCLAQ